MNKPRIAITMGDPTGVGPEVIVGAWNHTSIHDHATPLVVGQPHWIRAAVELLGTTHEVVEIDSAECAYPEAHVIPCLSAGAVDPELVPAKVCSAGGQAAFEALRLATDLALAGDVDAITTAPLNKAALNAAGHHYPGHTELLAALCGVDDVAMMLYLPPGRSVHGPGGLGVIHATLHTALRDVFDLLTPERILRSIQLA